MANIPRLTGRPWEDANRDLEEYLRKFKEAWSDGVPPGFNSVNPTIIAPDTASSPGSELNGWAAADHAHFVAVGIAVGLANANAEGSAASLARSDHEHKRDARILGGGVDVGTRNALDFIDTNTIEWTLTDNPGLDKVEFTADVDTAGFRYNVKKITSAASPYVVLLTDEYLVVDASGGAVTVLLPAVGGSNGRRLSVKKIDASANIVTLDGFFIAETIDGAGSFDLLAQHEVVEIVCDGTEWWIV
jgi:hypothetical protein